MSEAREGTNQRVCSHSTSLHGDSEAGFNLFNAHGQRLNGASHVPGSLGHGGTSLMPILPSSVAIITLRENHKKHVLLNQQRGGITKHTGTFKLEWPLKNGSA